MSDSREESRGSREESREESRGEHKAKSRLKHIPHTKSKVYKHDGKLREYKTYYRGIFPYKFYIEKDGSIQIFQYSGKTGKPFAKERFVFSASPGEIRKIFIGIDERRKPEVLSKEEYKTLVSRYAKEKHVTEAKADEHFRKEDIHWKKGNSILVLLKDGDAVWVGDRAYRFHPEEPISEFYSRIGSSGVSKAYGVTKNFVYLFEEHLEIPRKQILGEPYSWWEESEAAGGASKDKFKFRIRELPEKK